MIHLILLFFALVDWIARYVCLISLSVQFVNLSKKKKYRKERRKCQADRKTYVLLCAHVLRVYYRLSSLCLIGDRNAWCLQPAPEK